MICCRLLLLKFQIAATTTSTNDYNRGIDNYDMILTLTITVMVTIDIIMRK